MVVELGVGDHRDVGASLSRSGRTRRPRPRATPRSPSRRWRPSSGPRRRPGSSGPRAAQGVHDHARRRRLAVGAGDGDRRLQAGELAEQVGAVQLAARAALGVGRPRSRWSRRPRRPRARWPRRGRRAARSRPRFSVPAYGEPAARSDPVTLAPSACATTARPLIPAPPIPTKCSLRPDQGWSIPVTLGPWPTNRGSSGSRARRSATRSSARDSGRRSRPRSRPRHARGHVDRLGQVGDLPDRRAADPGRDARRLAADRAPARPGRGAAARSPRAARRS